MAEEKIALDQNEEKNKEIKNYGWGIRHLQIACMLLNMTCLIIVRSSIGVAVLAMSDVKHKNSTDIEVFDWDKKTQSVILSSFFWGYTVMQIPAGILARMFGGKPTIAFSLLANALICLSVPPLAAWGGWQFVCASRVAMGLTQSFLFPGTFTLLGQWLPARERTNFSGVVFGGAKIGSVLAMGLCGFLAESAYGWKAIFYAISGILFVNLVIWYLFAANSPREHRWVTEDERKFIEADLNVLNVKRPSTPWRCILRSRAVWALVPAQCSLATCYGFFLGDLPTYLEKGLGISLKSSALLSMLPAIGMWVGSTAASYISEKLHNNGLMSLTWCRKLFQTIALFGGAITLGVLAVLDPDHKTVVIVTIVTSFTLLGGCTAGFVVNQLDLSPNHAGFIMSVLNCSGTVCAGVIPLLASAILQNDPTNVGRWQMVFLLMAGICVGGGVLYLLFATSDRQPWDDLHYSDKKIAKSDELKPALSVQDFTDQKDCKKN